MCWHRTGLLAPFRVVHYWLSAPARTSWLCSVPRAMSTRTLRSATVTYGALPQPASPQPAWAPLPWPSWWVRPPPRWSSPPGAGTVNSQASSPPAHSGLSLELPPNPACRAGTSLGASSAWDRRDQQDSPHGGRGCWPRQRARLPFHLTELQRPDPGLREPVRRTPHAGTFLGRALSPWSKDRARTTPGGVRPGASRAPAGKRAFLPVPNRSPA